MDQNEINEAPQENVVTLKGMYETYFLDYASYVILERAVPSIDDGLKPVQRRILFAMKQMDDGRYHKVANIIGQTMQYHPHGDAAIGDALVHLGQKNLLIDCQGNWGDVRTGDRAAAARYIEARLTKFALEVLFNPQTTEWQLSYDGRKNEPVNLPSKFPLVLAQGVDGIAVGLSTKILPHNFIEIIKAAIQQLKGRTVKIYPDFQTGGQVDVSDYNDGKRGGKVRIRARIEQGEKNTLVIKDLPYAVTTTTMIDSILKASDKGKIKIKKVIDNTAKDVEIIVQLQPGVSPDITRDALFAFTNCEVSQSPNACVIIDDKPHFIGVAEILKFSVEQTKDLLRRELEIKRNELNEKLHFASLEKIFIENRIYRDIEECETWEAVIEAIDTALVKYIATPNRPSTGKDPITLLRDITQEDIVRLTEIKIKRISKFNSFKADELIANLNEQLAEVNHNLAHLTEFAIAFFERLLEKYGKGKERKTEITSFDSINATAVVANNAKLYVDRKEGFIGFGLKKEEFVSDCSDIDDVIAFLKDGTFKVSRIADKVFIGKNILHVAVWKKGDDRTTYNMAYIDGKTGKSYVKRFNITSITRDKFYHLTTGEKNSKVLHFSVHPNGEAEKVQVQLTQACTARIKTFEYEFGDLAIKGRGSKGNMLTKYPVRKVTQLEIGKSTLGAIKIWMDEVSGKMNTGERGKYLGEFDTGDQLLVLYNNGTYEVTTLDMNKRFELKSIIEVVKLSPETVISAVYYEGEKGASLVKRFQIETSKLNQSYPFITEHAKSKLLFATTAVNPIVDFKMRVKSKTMTGTTNLQEFIDVKGWKSLGNKLSEYKLTSVEMQEPVVEKKEEKLKTGDTIELDVNKDDKQGNLFG